MFIIKKNWCISDAGQYHEHIQAILEYIKKVYEKFK